MPFSSSSHNRPSHRRDFQIAIICALPLEYDAASLLVDEFWDQCDKQYGRTSGDMNKYRNGRIGVHNVVLMLLPKMGKAAVAGSTGTLRTSYPGVRIAFLVGICGGVPSSSTHEALLGDVVISDDIVEYDFGRQYPGKFIAKQGTEGNLGRANKDIRSLVAYLKTEPGRHDLRRDAADFLKLLQDYAAEKCYRCNYNHPGFHEDRLYKSSYRHKHTEKSHCVLCHEEFETYCHEAAQATCEELVCNDAYLVTRHNVNSARNSHRPCPEIFIGRVASADTVMRSGKHRDQVAKQYDVIAFEMEAAGIWDELPCVVVKGICDYADSHKNKRWQPFAAATAAAVLKSILIKYTSGDGAEPVVHNDQGDLSNPKASDTALMQSLTISNSAQTKIWRSLQDSIHDFTNILPADRRYQLESIKVVPSDESVLIFTAQLDHQNRDRKGRSIASRLYAVLKSVRDFSITIETFIAYPGIGALVWGSLKVTMLVIFSSIQYYEAFSELYMKLGGLFPRWTEYQVLYKTSTQLQAALCDFYASVIRYCTHVVDKSFEQEFQPDTDDIRRCHERLMNELSVAKALADYQDQQLQMISQKDSSSTRWRPNNLLLRANEKDNRSSWEMLRNERISKAKRQELLDSISTHDYLTPLKQSRRKRHNSTAQWLFSKDEFDQWVKGTGSPLLWCSGKIGSGKTILTASVIDKILTTKCSANVSLAFFFVRFDDWQSLKTENVLKSIIRQALLKVGLSQETEALLQDIQPRLTSGCEELLELLRDITVGLMASYIIIDGLDECEKPDRDNLLHTLSLLATVGSNTRLFLAGRDSVSGDVKRAFPGLGQISMSCLAVEADIAAYVEGAVQERLQSEDLVVGDSSLIEGIKKALREGADGISCDDTHLPRFLWVTFQIDELCAQHCDEDIRKAIVNLPQDLSETFNRVLGRILSGRNKEIAQKTFQWVAAAKTPLSLDELREAFSIEVGQEYSKPDRRPNDIHRVTSWCENFVQVDEENKLVQFAHHTVQQFLLQQSSESPLKEFHINIEDADHHIGEICVTYLNFNDFKTTLARRRQPLRNISPTAIAQTALKQERKSSNPLSIISNFKSGRRATPTNFDVVGILASLKQDTAETVGHELTHPFLKYASVNWIFHTTAFQDGKSRTWDDWRKMITNGHGLVQKPWGNRVFSASDHLMVKWSYEAHHYPLLRLIILSGGPSDSDKGHLMQFAAVSGDMALLDILLQGKSCGWELERACQFAVEHGHLVIVDRLLDAGAELSAGILIDGKIHTALYTAAKNGDIYMVDRLLAAGAVLNAYSDIDGGLRTALYAATLNNDLDVVERLLAAGADIDFGISCDGEHQTALYAAIKCGYSGMVERLLAAEANLHAGATTSSQRQTALYIAAGSGDEDVVNQLLEIGVDPDTPIYSDGELRTALYTAAKNGHFSTVSRLLSVGANTEDASSSDPTALYIAAQNGYLDIVDKLLTVGANANANVLMDGAHRTVLYTATQGGHLDIVERLLAAGANPNVWIFVDSKRQTALSLAAQNGDLHIVERLLAAGADLDVETSFGALNGAVLQTAASGGCQRIVEKLLDTGATWPSESLQRALQAAASSGFLDVVDRILAVGTIWPSASLRAALSAAASSGCLAVVERLLDIGDPWAYKNLQITLHEAAGGSQLDIADRLFAAGADVNYVSILGDRTRTALNAATNAGHQCLKQRLRDAGAYR
ncbi:hypothetical protein N7451_000134 [Penicillium sp. IBT 35674x]|nr:hypothetical protein N7451_000134 [Penicillium sp. IBT 35674x]